jgi:hypothetical protein
MFMLLHTIHLSKPDGHLLNTSAVTYTLVLPLCHKENVHAHFMHCGFLNFLNTNFSTFIYIITNPSTVESSPTRSFKYCKTLCTQHRYYQTQRCEWSGFWQMSPPPPILTTHSTHICSSGHGSSKSTEVPKSTEVHKYFQITCR